jgi:folylpolyglutamate synthase/dihydropteroate synthase
MAGRARQAGIGSVEIREDLGEAFAALLRRPERVLLVTGSLYLVSQVRPLAERAAGAGMGG